MCERMRRKERKYMNEKRMKKRKKMNKMKIGIK